MKRIILLLVVAALVALSSCTGGTKPTETEAATVVFSPVDTSSETVPEIIRETTPEMGSVPCPETEVEESAEETMVRYETVRNPVVPTANDPWVVEHEGRYYYCRSTGRGVKVSEIPSPHKLTDAGGSVVYTAPEGTAYSAEYWAPELHYIRGAWYIYVAADDGDNMNHRMYVLKGTSQDPTQPFEMVGQITDPTNRWAIDGTVLQMDDQLYFVWSGWKGGTNIAQHLYIAHMSDPCTIDSERVLISSPTYAWERVGDPLVNEGPAALYHGDDIFLVYSASGSWTDAYCLGLLTLVGDDPMDPRSWEKTDTPVFQAQDGVAYGPGHCSFTTAADGSVWMVYHANQTSGSGWAGRSGWIAPVTFADDGTPVFGRPHTIVRFPVSVETATP